MSRCDDIQKPSLNLAVGGDLHTSHQKNRALCQHRITVAGSVLPCRSILIRTDVRSDANHFLQGRQSKTCAASNVVEWQPESAVEPLTRSMSKRRGQRKSRSENSARLSVRRDDEGHSANVDAFCLADVRPSSLRAFQAAYDRTPKITPVPEGRTRGSTSLPDCKIRLRSR